MPIDFGTIASQGISAGIKYGLDALGSSIGFNRTKELMREQQAWQEKMWNKQNQYNSASAQVARYAQAGLNPYMMMNGGNAGQADLVSPVGASAQSGTDFSDVGQALSPEAYQGLRQQSLANQGIQQENELKKAQTERQVLENSKYIDETIARIEEMKSRRDLNASSRQLLNIQENFLQQSFKDRLDGIGIENAMHNQQRLLQFQQTCTEYYRTQLVELELEVSKQLAPYRVKEMIAQIANLYASAQAQRAAAGMYSAQAGLARNQAGLAKSQELLTDVERQSRAILNNYLPSEKAAELALKKLQPLLQGLQTWSSVVGTVTNSAMPAMSGLMSIP